MNSRELAAWVVLVVWAACYVRKIADPTFPVPAELLPVVLAATGYLFASSVKDRLTRKDPRDDDS